VAYIPPTTTCESCGTILPLCQRAECGKPIPRNQHESAASWGKREYCSTTCANAVRQILIHGVWSPAVKPCSRQGCDQECVQRKNESPASFLERKYCGSRCAALARRDGPISTREQRVVSREIRAMRPKPVKKTKHPDVGIVNKPLIRPDVPVVKVEPPRDVWRPAAWRKLEETG
jgi:hypothetical protein